MGFRSTVWGPALWQYMFMMAFNFESHPDPIEVKLDTYEAFFASLGPTLPCLFCREFFNAIYAQTPLRDFLLQPFVQSTPYPVAYYVYYLKDLVNDKLLTQEKKYYRRMARAVDMDPELTPAERTTRKETLSREIFFTQPTPPFDDVVRHYLQFESGCEGLPTNRALQSCRHVQHQS